MSIPACYDKRNAFRFPIANYPWLSRDVPRFQSYGMYISQLVRGRPFDSEGGGGLALFGNKYSDLENAGNK